MERFTGCRIDLGGRERPSAKIEHANDSHGAADFPGADTSLFRALGTWSQCRDWTRVRDAIGLAREMNVQAEYHPAGRVSEVLTVGAEGGIRTLTGLLPTDFKS